MRYSALTAGVLALGLSACATMQTYLVSRGDDRFAAGLAALRRGDYVTANEELGWVVQRYEGEPIGQKALLTLAAVEIDPRNPQRRLLLGAELANAYVKQPTSRSDWVLPIAQTLHLLSIEMGVAEERVAQVEGEKQEAERTMEEVERTLPRLPTGTQPITTRARRVTEERDQLAKKVDQLETQLQEREKKVTDLEKELERIKKSLKG
jgi:DNA repair exonuclease SbcCD ATPase subunit